LQKTDLNCEVITYNTEAKKMSLEEYLKKKPEADGGTMF
jgi:hypothetical protein